jgi:putative transposase
MTSEIEDKISEYIEDFYCLGFSKATISAVTDKIIPMIQEWKVYF